MYLVYLTATGTLACELFTEEDAQTLVQELQYQGLTAHYEYDEQEAYA